MARRGQAEQRDDDPDPLVFSGPKIDAAVSTWLDRHPKEPLHTLSGKLKISDRQLNNWRNTARPNPNGNAMIRLAQLVGIDVEDLTETE